MHVFVLTTVAVATLLTSAVPTQKTPQPTAADVLATLGKPPVSPQIKNLVESLGELPQIEYPYWHKVHDPENTGDTSYYLIWKQKGLAMSVRENAATAVWLYNQDADEYHRYVGELPDGLKFDDNPDIVAKKLGPPDEEPIKFERPSEDGTFTEGQWIGYKKGLYNIEFRRPAEGRWRIHSIGLHAQKKP